MSVTHHTGLFAGDVSALVLESHRKHTTTTQNMFLPKSNQEAEKAAKRTVLERVENWSLGIIPQELRDDVQLTAQEMVCGDPSCSPIDTVITIVFNRYVEFILIIRIHDL